jgi:hypothetical protein
VHTVKAMTRLCVLALLLLAIPARGQAQADVPVFDPCHSGQLSRVMLEKLRSRFLLDVHGLAQVAQSLCPASPERFEWSMWDALALEELDEPLRAQALLQEVLTTGTPPERSRAAVLLALGHLRRGDTTAFEASRAHLVTAETARLTALAAIDDEREFAKRLAQLPQPQRDEVAARFSDYRRTHTRRPWLAGVLSTLLPGAGQAYAGSWQGAAVAFVLNAALIGATVELAYRRLYFSATAAGNAASIFYFGNLMNATDLAQRRNERAAAPAREAIERLLVPEAYP